MPTPLSFAQTDLLNQNPIARNQPHVGNLEAFLIAFMNTAISDNIQLVETKKPRPEPGPDAINFGL